MTVLLRPMELMREIVPQLKSLCEANYAESILKHIIDQNCQGMGKISPIFDDTPGDIDGMFLLGDPTL